MLPHGPQEGQGTDKVVGVIFQRLGNTFPNRLEPREMDDRMDIGKPREQLPHLLFATQL